MGNFTSGIQNFKKPEGINSDEQTTDNSKISKTSKIGDYPEVLGSPESHNAERHVHGYWIGKDTERLYNTYADPLFGKYLAKFLKDEKCNSALDVGSGNGFYSQLIADNGIFINCYDGNPDTQYLSGGRCGIMDFSQQLHILSAYDWVLSLKVGKHIPKKYEDNFIQNLHGLNRRGIIICWGGPTGETPGSDKGVSYFNHRSDDYIINKFTKLGYIHDIQAQNKLRNVSKDPTFQNRLLIFRKQT